MPIIFGVKVIIRNDVIDSLSSHTNFALILIGCESRLLSIHGLIAWTLIITADTHETREDPPHAQDLLLYNSALSSRSLIGHVKRQVIRIIIKP